MKVAVCLFITFAVVFSSIESSPQVHLRELFPESAYSGDFPPPIKPWHYATHRQQLSHLRRLDPNGRITAFDASSILQRRGLFIMGWVMRGILNPIQGSPSIYYVNGTKMELTLEELEQLGVNHIFSFVQLIDSLAAQRRVSAIPGQAALPVKTAAHYESSIAAYFQAMRQSKYEKERLQSVEGRSYQVNHHASLVAIRQAYNGAYDVTLQNYLRLHGRLEWELH